jgi:hypothetical protein
VRPGDSWSGLPYPVFPDGCFGHKFDVDGLTQAEWAKLLLAGEAKTGAAWDIEREVAAKVLTCFFPQTATCDFTLATRGRGGLASGLLPSNTLHHDFPYHQHRPHFGHRPRQTQEPGLGADRAAA